VARYGATTAIYYLRLAPSCKQIRSPSGDGDLIFVVCQGLGQITWVSISAITTTTGTPRSHRITGIFFASIELLRTLRSAEKVTPFHQHCSWGARAARSWAMTSGAIP
jgi:hypothetical protein